MRRTRIVATGEVITLTLYDRDESVAAADGHRDELCKLLNRPLACGRCDLVDTPNDAFVDMFRSATSGTHSGANE